MRKVLLLVALMGFVLPATADARRRRKPRLTKKDRLAKQHFAQGETFYQQGEFEKALDHYKKAMSYRRHPSMIFNIAQCHWELKKYERAKFFYKLYLDEAKNPGNRAAVDKRIKECDDAIAAERKKNMKGTIQLATHPPGAQVRVDAATGPVALTTPGSLALAPGVHTLHIQLDSYRSVVRSVKVEPGKTIVLDVKLVSSKPIPIAKPKPVPSAVVPLHKRGWFWTGVVATAVFTVSAVLTGSLALARNSTWEETRLESDRKVVRTLAVTTDVMIALSAAAAVSTTVGIILYLRSKRKERPKAVVAPSCGPTGCGLWVTGRF